MVNPSHCASGTRSSVFPVFLDVVLWAPCWCSHEPPPRPWCWPSWNVWELSMLEGSASSKGYHGIFPVFSLQLAAFFRWFWFAPQETPYHTCLDKSLVKGVDQCHTLWESCPAELGCTAAMWWTCGHEMCVFSGQNCRYPQSSRFPQLSCAKPLKSIVFLLWPRAFDFLSCPVLRKKPETVNSKHEHEENTSVQLCAGCVQEISHINIDRINRFLSWHSHQAIFILKPQLHF